MDPKMKETVTIRIDLDKLKALLGGYFNNPIVSKILDSVIFASVERRPEEEK